MTDDGQFGNQLSKSLHKFASGTLCTPGDSNCADECKDGQDKDHDEGWNGHQHTRFHRYLAVLSAFVGQLC
jgi:hypothetical protein